MSLSATLTIVASMIAMISPSMTVMVIRATGAFARARKGLLDIGGARDVTRGPGLFPARQRDGAGGRSSRDAEPGEQPAAMHDGLGFEAVLVRPCVELA